jgi:hypothetical protein
MRLFLMCALMLCASFTFGGSTVPPDSRRAFQIYSDVLSGKRKFDSLSQDEKIMVVQVMEAVRRSCSNLSEQCEAACEAANQLQNAAEDLVACAKRHDLTNDCSRQFRDVRSEHDTYESAVSAAGGDCE